MIQRHRIQSRAPLWAGPWVMVFGLALATAPAAETKPGVDAAAAKPKSRAGAKKRGTGAEPVAPTDRDEEAKAPGRGAAAKQQVVKVDGVRLTYRTAPGALAVDRSAPGEPLPEGTVKNGDEDHAASNREWAFTDVQAKLATERPFRSKGTLIPPGNYSLAVEVDEGGDASLLLRPRKGRSPAAVRATAQAREERADDASEEEDDEELEAGADANAAQEARGGEEKGASSLAKGKRPAGRDTGEEKPGARGERTPSALRVPLKVSATSPRLEAPSIELALTARARSLRIRIRVGAQEATALLRSVPAE